MNRTRYSAFKVLKEALTGHKGWEPTWRDAEPKADGYDVIIVGGGGHGLATAYYLAKNHGHYKCCCARARLDRFW